MRSCWVTFVALALALAPACSDDNGPGRDGSTGDGPSQTDGPDPSKKLTWLAPETLDTNRAGEFAMAVSCGKEIGIAYFRSLKDQVIKTCPATFGGVPTDKPRPANDVYYVHFDGVGWGTPVKVDQTYGTTEGLSVTADATCSKIYIGYLGGELSKQECKSGDAVIATSSDKGQTWTSATVNATGPVGDSVGQWMSVALDAAGAVHSVYRDVHFGYYEYDGNAKSSLWFDAAKASGDVGAGKYASLVFDSTDRPVAVHYNGTKTTSEGGIQLIYREGTAWKSQQLSASNTEGSRLHLGYSGSAYGVTFYKSSKQALYYLESSDLKTWSETQVDTNLTSNGKFAALAFDSRGNPAISYYLCNDYGSSSCDYGKDGLNFAYRSGTKWKITEKIDDGGAQKCGEHTALAFGPGDEPVIAYRCVRFDNLSGEWVDTLKVIRGVYK